MFHILVYLATWAEEDIGIAVLVVKFGDGAVVATQTRKCECITVDKQLALLAVALRGNRDLSPDPLYDGDKGFTGFTQ